MKKFTLFKRDDSGRRIPAAALPQHRERVWHFRFVFRGDIYTRTLETSDAALAQTRARAKFNEIRDAVVRGELDRLDRTKTRHTVHASLSDLFAAYRRSSVRASEDTREANIRAALIILRKLNPGLTDEALLEQPFPKLFNADAAEAWFRHPDVKPVTANSIWRQAASLCAPRARFLYAKEKIDHAAIEGFLKTGSVCQHTVSKAPPRPPSDEVVAQTIADWENLEDRNLFLAIGHELSFGLRVGEVAQARTSWWQTKYGSPMLCATGQFKHNHEGYFELPALDPYYTTMRTKALSRAWLDLSKDDFIIAGTDPYRRDTIEREVTEFLRQRGWTTHKTNHALRAYAGGLVCLKFGVYKAKEFLRHSSVKVTEQHYLYLMKNPLVDSIREQCPVAWAKLKTEPVLTILPAAQQAG